MAFDFGNNDEILQFLLSRSGKNQFNPKGIGNYPMTASNNNAGFGTLRTIGNAKTNMPISNANYASAISTPSINPTSTQALSNQNMQLANTTQTASAGSDGKSVGGKGGFMSMFGGGGSGSGGYISENNSIDDQTQAAIDKAKAPLNSVPFVGAFKGIANAAEGIGGQIGGEKGGNIVQSFVDPLGRAMEVFKNKNYSKGQKALAGLGLLTAPFLTFLKPKAVIDDPIQDKMNKLKDYQLKKIQDNNFLKSSDFYKGMINQNQSI